MRLSHVVLFTVLCALGACVYHVANLYQTAERQLKRLNVNVEREHENIRVLSAEWAFLTNPVRLEKLAHDYLKLQSMDGSQLVAISAMPTRGQFSESDAEIDINAVLATAKKAEAAAMPRMKALPVNTGGRHE